MRKPSKKRNNLAEGGHPVSLPEGGRPCPPDENKNNAVFKTKRRTIPHWIFVGAIYFLTWRLARDQIELTPDERNFVSQTLHHFQNVRYELISYVIMNDHIHVLFQPMNDESIPRIIHSWKSFTANGLQRHYGRIGAVWQEEYFDRIIRTEKQFYRTVRYILNNPQKRWQTQEYPWMYYCATELAGRDARRINRQGHYLSSSKRIAFWQCSLFSASSHTTELGLSITSSVTSSPRCAGRQCRNRASFFASEKSGPLI